MPIIDRKQEKIDKFEYEALPASQCASIRELTREIKENLKTTVDTIWQIGKNLVKARSQIGIRQFNLWLKAEFGWSRRTAYNFISVYEAFPESIRANFAQIDISASALYLLAAPSTQPEIRMNFFERAVDGERISYSAVQESISMAKGQISNADRESSNLEINDLRDLEKQNLLVKHEQANIGSSTSELEETIAPIDSAETDTEQPLLIRPAWNSIQSKFSLFWGDTMSPRFHERLPDRAFVLAFPSIKWHHDWLKNDSRCCIAIPRSQLDYQLVMRLLSALAVDDTPLILPWIPSWKTIELALGLDLKVYAGDPSLDLCKQIANKLGFEPRQIDRKR